MKKIFIFIFIAIAGNMLAQSTGDTITVQTFNYSQTRGSGIRDTVIDFPDNPELTYE